MTQRQLEEFPASRRELTMDIDGTVFVELWRAPHALLVIVREPDAVYPVHCIPSEHTNQVDRAMECMEEARLAVVERIRQGLVASARRRVEWLGEVA